MTPHSARTPLGVFLIATLPALLGATPPTAANLSNLPLAFEENRGQVDPSAKFFARGEGYGVLVAQDGVILTSTSGHVRMTLLGTTPSKSTGQNLLSGKVNYFAGNDSSKWLSNIDTYGEVVNQGVYRGIDVVYYGRQKRLEYDFNLAAGADPNQIRMRVSGAGRVSVDPTGDLTVLAGQKELRWHKPVAYQAWGNDKRVVECSYVVDDEGIVSFRMGKFDHSKPLVIDPVIAWATFYGGSQDDEAHSLAIDSQGNPVIAGLTESQDFPGSKYIGIAGYNAFVSKLSADGTRALFTTYIAYGTSGLDNGPNQQVPCVALALDSQDNAYITGTTSAFGGTVSTTPGAYLQKPPSLSSLQIGYVMKISSDGSRIVYSTLLGSSQGDVLVLPTGIAVDGSGAPTWRATNSRRTARFRPPPAPSREPARWSRRTTRL